MIIFYSVDQNFKIVGKHSVQLNLLLQYGGKKIILFSNHQSNLFEYKKSFL